MASVLSYIKASVACLDTGCDLMWPSSGSDGVNTAHNCSLNFTPQLWRLRPNHNVFLALSEHSWDKDWAIHKEAAIWGPLLWSNFERTIAGILLSVSKSFGNKHGRKTFIQKCEWFTCLMAMTLFIFELMFFFLKLNSKHSTALIYMHLTYKPTKIVW